MCTKLSSKLPGKARSTPRKGQAALPCRSLRKSATSSSGRPGSARSKEKRSDRASASEVASSANQGVGAFKKTTDFAANSARLSNEAREVMQGVRAGADGAARPQRLSSALWSAFNTTEGGGGGMGKTVDTALTPMSVAGNVTGTREALGAIKSGKLGEGSKGLLLSGGGLVGDGLGVVDSAASAVEGAGKLAPRLNSNGQAAARIAGLAPKAGKIAATAGKASGIAGGALAIAEGGFQVKDGFQEGDKAKAGRGALKSAAGGMMVAGALTGNPILAGAGGLTYAGVALYENREAIGKAATTSAKFVASTTVKGAQKLDDMTEAVKDKAVESAKDRVKSASGVAKKALGWLS